jgi:hypothetical protein
MCGDFVNLVSCSARCRVGALIHSTGDLISLSQKKVEFNLFIAELFAQNKCGVFSRMHEVDMHALSFGQELPRNNRSVHP